MSDNSENKSIHQQLAERPDCSSPRIAILIGGPSAYFDFPTGWYAAAMQFLEHAVGDLGGSMALLASQNTPSWALETKIRPEVNHLRLQIYWNDHKQDEYSGILEWADGIVIMPDNTEMADAACSSGKPVFLTGADLAKGRLFSFYRRLKQEGLVQSLDELKKLT